MVSSRREEHGKPAKKHGKAGPGKNRDRPESFSRIPRPAAEIGKEKAVHKAGDLCYTI
jgi:hypothetical protein